MKFFCQLLDRSNTWVLITIASLCRLNADTNPPIRLGISITGEPGARRAILSWNSQTGAVYKLQWRASLAPTVPWETIDVFQADGSTMRVTLDGDPLKEESHFVEVTGLDDAGLNATGFYQLEGPQPQIFSVEPAVVSSGGGDIYIIGQCLGESGTLRLGPANGGIERPGSGDGRTIRVSIPPMPEGTYDVSWIVDGIVVASGYKLFSVTGQPTPVGEAAARLLEPPVEPPASPERRHLKVPGRLEYPNLCLYSGELQIQAVDFVIPGRGLDFAWVRTYRSRTGRTTPMGHNWDHAYNIYLEQTTDGIAVYDGTGRRDVYYQGPNGVYSRNEFFNEGLLQNNTFMLTFPDSGQWQFHPFDGSSAAGKIALCVDRNGNALSFNYDSAGRLIEVVDTLDQTNRIAYTPGGFLESVTDSTGRRWTYGYHDARSLTGAPGDLASVTTPPVTGTPHGNDFPAGKTTSYEYTRALADERLNHNLVGITDPAGQTWLRVRYRQTTDPLSIDFDAVEATLRGIDKKDIWRGRVMPTPQNRFAVTRCIENDGVGNVREYLFDSRNRLLARREFTGRAIADQQTTPTENRPSGKLRPCDATGKFCDPDFFETRYFWNVDSLCTRLELPKGNNQEWAYERAFDQDASPRKKGDLRVAKACCADVNRDGMPDVVAARFQYHPNFGSPPSHGRDGLRLKGPDGKEHVITDGWQMLGRMVLSGHSVGSGVWGDDNGMLNFATGPRQSTSMDGTFTHSHKFVTRMTDARGNVTTYTYDAHGNLDRCTGPFIVGNDPPVVEFEYNDDGQVTARVHPANSSGHRRRDRYDYHTIGGRSGYLRAVIVDVASDPTDDPLALTTRYEYDAVGNVTRVVDPREFDILYTYNALDQCSVRQTPKMDFGSVMRYATTFTYDANDNVVQVDHENRDHTGTLHKENPHWSSFFEYDELNRCRTAGHELAHVLQGGPKRATTRYDYDANDNVIAVHSPEAVNGVDPNAIVTCEYDERDLLFRVTRAPALSPRSAVQYDYDANGNPTRWNNDPYSEDVLRHPITTSEYDGLDRLVRTIDPMGNVETYSYDANGNLLRQRLDGELEDVPGSAGNRRLSETQYQYDALNRLVRSVDSFFDVFTELAIGAGASTTTYAYAPNGRLVRETDDNGNTTRYTYDRADRLAMIVDPKTNVVACTYDASGNLVTLTETHRSDLGTPEQVFVSSATYDGLDRCSSVSDNVGNTSRYEYDSRGNLLRHHDPRGSVSGWEYDGLSRTILIEADLDGDGEFEPLTDITVSKGWDDNSRLVSTTDANGNTTRYAYDALDRCILVTQADGTLEALVWSPRHNLVLRTDANGNVTSNSFDLLDRCIRRDIVPAAGVATTTTFETFAYDGESRLVRASNDGVAHTFVWDSRSQVWRQSSGGLTLSASYDGAGNRISCQLPSGVGVQYAYDRLNQPISLSTIVGGRVTQLATYGYDGPGRLSRIARLNGINTRINWNGHQGVPNQPGDFGWQQVLRVNHSRSGGSPVIDQRIFAYDRNQNKTARALLVPFVQGAGTNRMEFSYDRGNRLDGNTLFRDGLRTRSYVLDPNGNRQRVIEDGTVQTYQMDNTSPEPADFQVNQYTITPFGPLQYDRNGNLVSVDSPAGSTIYRYDYADRLVQVDRSVGPALHPVASFAYDALGRRVSKTTHFDPPLSPVTTEYFRDIDDDCDGIVEERENGTLKRTYVMPHVFETKGRVMLTETGETIYFHEDDLGSTLALTDAAGNVLERYDYDEFGVPEFLDAQGRLLTGSDGLPVSSSSRGHAFLFHGMAWDSETGLYCAGQRDGTPLLEWTFEKGWPCRYMSPHMGRYIMRAGVPLRFDSTDRGNNENWDFTGSSFAHNKPVSGTFKIDAKKQKQWLPANFRMAGGGGGGGGSGGCDSPLGVMFNPKEYRITKAKSKEDVYVWKVHSRSKEDVYVWKVRGRSKDVYVWKVHGRPRAKQDVYVWKVKKEEGGRHTPFHNKKASYGGMTGIGHPRAAAALSRDILKSYFETGDVPTQEQFRRPGPPRYSNIVLKRGMAAREGGRTIGAGQVTEILD